ncbi:Vacuolar membrane protease [Trichinella spiralis]|uniref:Vacuolar membrane protease n=1 Tax=Trichinella spiralis TaxID=6334 RepID=A0ABR3KAK5_TRISP
MSTAGSNGQTMDFKNASWSSVRETSLTSSLTNRCSSTTEINSDSDATLNGFEERFDFTDKQHQHYHHLHQHHQPQKEQQQQQQQQRISKSCNLTPKPNGGLIHSIRRLFKLSTTRTSKLIGNFIRSANFHHPHCTLLTVTQEVDSSKKIQLMVIKQLLLAEFQRKRSQLA